MSDLRNARVCVSTDDLRCIQCLQYNGGLMMTFLGIRSHPEAKASSPLLRSACWESGEALMCEQVQSEWS